MTTKKIIFVDTNRRLEFVDLDDEKKELFAKEFKEDRMKQEKIKHYEPTYKLSLFYHPHQTMEVNHVATEFCKKLVLGPCFIIDNEKSLLPEDLEKIFKAASNFCQMSYEFFPSQNVDNI